MRISDWSSDVCSSDLVKLAQRPGLRPVMPVYQSLEDHHVLVLMIEDDVLEPPVGAVGGTVKHCGMAFGADRAGGHQPAAVHPADPRIIHSIAFQIGGGRDVPVVLSGPDQIGRA